jgi:hypothetical protein
LTATATATATDPVFILREGARETSDLLRIAGRRSEIVVGTELVAVAVADNAHERSHFAPQRSACRGLSEHLGRPGAVNVHESTGPNGR